MSTNTILGTNDKSAINALIKKHGLRVLSNKLKCVAKVYSDHVVKFMAPSNVADDGTAKWTDLWVRTSKEVWKLDGGLVVMSKIPIVREDPETPSFAKLKLLENSSYKLLAVVLANPADSFRVALTDVADDAELIFAESARVGANVFTDIDAGKLMRVSKSIVNIYFRRMTLPFVFNRKNDEEIYPIIDDSGRIFIPHNKRMSMSANYLKHFADGSIPEYLLSGFRFVRKKDTLVIEYPGNTASIKWHVGLDILKQKVLGCSKWSTFEDVVSTMAITSGEEVTVNGTRVHVKKTTNKSDSATLWYVNNRKISHSDLSEVVQHITCYPDDQKTYDSYLDTVSKMSLKFHKAMASGMELAFPSTTFDGLDVETENKDDIRVPGDGDPTKLYVRWKLPLFKKVGEKAFFHMFGEKRVVCNFDRFCRKWVSNTPNRIYNSDYIRVAGTSADGTAITGDLLCSVICERRSINPTDVNANLLSFLKVLIRLDEDLTEETKIVKKLELNYIHYPEQMRYYRPQMILDPDPKNIAKIEKLRELAAKNMQASLAEARATLRRSYELFKKVMADTGAEYIQHDSLGHAYRVTGASGRRYIVQESTASVHAESSNGELNHICIVKAVKDVAGYDYLSSLLTALSSDIYTAKNIHTLRNIVHMPAA